MSSIFPSIILLLRYAYQVTTSFLFTWAPTLVFVDTNRPNFQYKDQCEKYTTSYFEDLVTVVTEQLQL